jgi:hypothetical protein
MAKQTGTSVDVLNTALRVMAKNLNTGAGQAIAFQLGLDFKKIKDLKPEEQFKVIARELQKIQDSSKRTALTTAIFGRGSSNLGEMIANFRELSAAAEDQTFFTEEQIRAADEFGDAMARINTTLMAIAAESGFIQWVADVADRLEKTINLLNRAPQEGERGTSGKEVFGKAVLANWINMTPAMQVSKRLGFDIGKAVTGTSKDSLFMPGATQTEVVEAINRHHESTKEIGKNTGTYP